MAAVFMYGCVFNDLETKIKEIAAQVNSGMTDEQKSAVKEALKSLIVNGVLPIAEAEGKAILDRMVSDGKITSAQEALIIAFYEAAIAEIKTSKEKVN